MRSLLFILCLWLCLLFPAPANAQMPQNNHSLSHNPTPISSPRPATGTRMARFFANMGYMTLGRMFHQMEEIPSQAWTSIGPSTLFAPSEKAFVNNTQWRISPQNLIASHTIKGAYSSPGLALLPSGTILHSMIPNHSFVLTRSPDDYLFIEGVEITHPDLYSERFFTVHGVDRFLFKNPDTIPLLPLPEEKERLISSLGMEGYGILAVAMRRVIFSQMETLRLENMTVFAPDDNSIMSEGVDGFLGSVKYQVIPNARFLFHDLLRLPARSAIETLVPGERVVVEIANSTKYSDAVEVFVNGVPVIQPDALSNSFVVVHGIPRPLPRLSSTL